MLKKSIWIIALLCFAATISLAQTGKRRAASKRTANENNLLITALINSTEVRGMFGDDAMYAYTAAPEMRAIFALREKAIPLLIAHLDDTRLLKVSTSTATVEKTEEFTVTVGAACFDMLTFIIRQDARFFDKSCLDDLNDGAEGHTSFCAKDKYAVFPEDFWAGEKQDSRGIWRGQTLTVKAGGRRAKRNWQTAYRKRWIRYVKFKG